MRPSAQAWARARTAFEGGAATANVIALGLGIAPATLRRRARAEGWRVPAEEARDDTDRSGRARRDQLLARLYALLRRQARALERRLKVQDGTTASPAADSERDARTLAALLRSLRTLQALAAAEPAGTAATVPPEEHERTPDGEGGEDPRLVLEHRLARFRESVGRDALSGEPESG